MLFSKNIKTQCMCAKKTSVARNLRPFEDEVAVDDFAHSPFNKLILDAFKIFPINQNVNKLSYNNHDSAVTIADIATSPLDLKEAFYLALAQIHKNPNRKLTIAGREVLVIASAINGCLYSWHDLYHLGSDVLEGAILDSLCLQWGIDPARLAAKLSVAPISVLQEVVADVQEAWRHHKGAGFFPFLESRHYRFLPLTGSEFDAEHPCVVAASLADGSIVSDRKSSHVSSQAIMPVTAALARVDPHGRHFIQEEVKFPEIVGTTACVSTSSSDEIFLAQRPGRCGLTRFVKGREPEPCDTVFVVLKNIRPCRYLLVTGFVGHRPEPEPWDKRAFGFAKNPAVAQERSVKFWTEHALVYDPVMIVPGSERAEV